MIQRFETLKKNTGLTGGTSGILNDLGYQKISREIDYHSEDTGTPQPLVREALEESGYLSDSFYTSFVYTVRKNRVSESGYFIEIFYKKNPSEKL